MWQPIETAPKDGRLIKAKNGSSVYLAQYVEEHTHGWETEKGTWVNPTHWMPLPPPPTE